MHAVASVRIHLRLPLPAVVQRRHGALRRYFLRLFVALLRNAQGSWAEARLAELAYHLSDEQRSLRDNRRSYWLNLTTLEWSRGKPSIKDTA